MAKEGQLSKEEILKKKKRQALLKKKKEEQAAAEAAASKEFLSDEERLSLASDLKKNALATFAQFDFYKDGYKKSLGILIFNMLSVLIAFSAFIYSAFIYKAPPSFIGVNSNRQLMIEYPLTEPVFSDAEIVNFAATAYRDINNYNYVNLRSNYFSGLKSYYTEDSLNKYKESFLNTKEMVFIQENSYIVESTILRGVKIDKKESDLLSSQIGKKIWVVKMKSIKTYQNKDEYIRKNYETTMKVMRVEHTKNERGIAIQSFVDKEIK